MSQGVGRATLFVCVLLSIHRDVAAQTSARLAWDEDPSSQVNGFIVSIDGVAVDYGLSPLSSNLTCGCSIALPFSGGSHTLQVIAYNTTSQAPSSILTVAPVAQPGGPYTGTVNSPLSVDGSASQNPTGTITSYAWNWGDGTGTTSATATTTHTYSASGTFPIALTVTDNAGARATATTSATIAAALPPPPTVDTPPVAVDDSARVKRRGRSVTIPVLLNDSDPDGDPLTILTTGTPAEGTVRVSDGTIVYTSARQFTGLVSFTYQISDGRGGTATATVRVTVTN